MNAARHGKRGRQMGEFVFDSYSPNGFYCEMLGCPATAQIRDRLGRMPISEFKRRAAGVELGRQLREEGHGEVLGNLGRALPGKFPCNAFGGIRKSIW